MTGKTFLEVRAYSTSWVRQPAQVWVLDSLRLLAIQLRHCLMADGSGDYFSNTLRYAAQVSCGPKLLSMSAREGIDFTSTGGRGQK